MFPDLIRVLLLLFLFSDICHQILDLYSQGKQPIPQQPQMQEKDKPQPSPTGPLSQPGGNPVAPPPAKKSSPQASPPRPVKRQHVRRRVRSPLSVRFGVRVSVLGGFN